MKTQNAFSFRSVQYLAITHNWLTEMENFDVESKFLHFLFEDYFVNLHSSYFTTKLNDLESRLNDLMREAVHFKKETDIQLLILQMMIDGKVKENSDYLNKRQVNLEMEIKDFSEKFAELKKSLYELAQSATVCHERFSSPCIDKLV